ncbi:ABC transporter permease [bacterium]|nr:ABC transporter permease [bacterium]
MSFRRLWILMRREALATLRDPFTISILVAVPLMALLLFSSILSTEVTGLPLGVLDLSDGPTSRRIVRELAAGGNFAPTRWSSRPAIESALRSGDLGAAIVLPPDLERRRGARGEGSAAPQVELIYDGGEAVLAANAEAYLKSLVLAAVGRATREETPVVVVPPTSGDRSRAPDVAAGGDVVPAEGPAGRAAAAAGPAPRPRGSGAGGIRVVPRALFNPTLDGRPFMVAGTFGFVLSFAATLIIAVSVVNERFAGTFEQLQVTPATSIEILLGKVLPIGAVFSVDVVLMMLVAGWLYGVWPAGSALFFVLLSVFYMVVSLSLGMLISATSATAAEAVSKTVLLSTPLIQLSGFAFPVRNMSTPFRWFAELIPATHYIRMSRAIYLRGEGPLTLLPEIAIIAAMGLGLGALALRAIGRRT